MSAAVALERRESLTAIRLLLQILLLSFLLLRLLLQLGKSRAVKGAIANATMFQRSAVEARAVVVETLADDFTTANDNTAMTVVQRRLGGLLEAKVEVVVGLHLAVSLWWKS